MDESTHVFGLCFSEEDKSVELKTFLEEHPDVDVNLFQNVEGGRSIHAAVIRGHVSCVRLLIDAKADLEVRDKDGRTALRYASGTGRQECLQVLIENKADVKTADDEGITPTHTAAQNGYSKCVSMLINARADVNAGDIHGLTPVMYACGEDRLTCLQLLLDNKADPSVKSNRGFDAVWWSMLIPNEEPSHRVPGMPFAVLSCNTDSKNVRIDNEFVTQVIVDTHTNEYKKIHNFIDECHTITNLALSEDVVVDTRVGRGDNGLYHEPLEQVLLYLGLSMKKNQTVNKSIDGKSIKRALMPGHPVNANLWYELYQRNHCSTCSTRQAKLKNCTCFTMRYCNSDCQRKHWQTHKPSHNAILMHKKKK
jgi:serine/threonine-protein phosphatase 6 regulatory ankyrin repeat subunit B